MSAPVQGRAPAPHASMKAIIYFKHGPPEVLKLEEIDKPVPQDEEVLIKVRAAGVNPLDWRLLQGGPAFVRVLSGLRPKMKHPGVDVAGVVEAVGRSVTQFKPGDAVFGMCKGAFAEYACAAESALVMKPQSVTFEQAASCPVAAYTALQGLRDRGRVEPGHNKVLIVGASGGVGTFAVQIAKWLGAHVTGVCSTRNVELVRSLGADRVIDYTREDFTKLPDQYDLILDCVGTPSLSASRRVLTSKGRFLLVGAPHAASAFMLRLFHAFTLSRLGSQKFTFFFARSSQPDLKIIAELVASGKLRPVIDRSYPLREVPDALRYSEQGHARGKIVITVNGET